MDYYELIQEPGDCIFIPYAMLHQVEKVDEGLQLAASWMFLPETMYDEEVCRDAPLHEDLPLAAMDTLFMYAGKGVIPQGYDDPLNFMSNVRAMMRKRKSKYLTVKLLTAALVQGNSAMKRFKDKHKRIRQIHKDLSAYAADPGLGLTAQELQRVPLRLWAKPAAEGDSEGPLDCDIGQEYFPCDDAEFSKMTAFVDRVVANHTRSPGVKSRVTNRRVWPSKSKKSKGRTEL
mmetsp:Transcript_42539/g.95665  ORF Transcript_42539/g.95665 Transcript_42539/m.95665 type:complete len:232 (-) Transcript_42539:6-701(-)